MFEHQEREGESGRETGEGRRKKRKRRRWGERIEEGEGERENLILVFGIDSPYFPNLKLVTIRLQI